MFVSEAPCANAIMLIPFRPSASKNLPATPGTCFIFCPTMATVDKLYSTPISLMLPISISEANSSLSTFCEMAASDVLTPIEVLFSDDACETRNTLIPF